jgi:peptidoglycan/LPS O-acetylase OafA/YrhL
MGHVLALDGVRGVAILLVLFAHLALPGFAAGGVAGVTLFFVLSGFLITRLLIEELAGRGSISLRRFYRRRALRLLPCLLVVVAVTSAYQLLGGAGDNVDAARVLPSLFAVFLYVGNWVRASGQDLGLLGHTWSLAIEEQFYLLWPAVLALAWRRGPRVLLALTACAAVLATLDRALLWHGSSSVDRVYFASDTRADAVLLGCALALWAASDGRLPRGRWVVIAAVAALGAALVAARPSGMYLNVIAPTAAAVGGVLLLSHLVTGGPGRFLCWSPLTYTGRISYGLYLWHVPLVWILLPRLANWPLGARAVAVGALSYVVASASYFWIEKPFLRRKNVVEAQSPPPARSVPATAPLLGEVR